MAEHGFAALAIDMYGDKKVTTDVPQASEWMSQTFQQPDTIVDRASAGLATLAAQPEVDTSRLAAIGFCYGGKVVLDLARTGADLKAVVTFHAANVSPRNVGDAKNIKAEILVLHGELDSMLPLDAIAEFKQEMNAAHITHEVIVFEGAKHGFSNRLAVNEPKPTMLIWAMMLKQSKKDSQPCMNYSMRNWVNPRTKQDTFCSF